MNDDKWKVTIKKSAKNDLRKVMSSPLKNSFQEIKKTLENDPYTPNQSFEKLQPPGAGLYSRRLNSQHRVVYKINKENRTVSIYSCWAHYE